MKPRRLIEAGPEPAGAQLDRATLRRFIAIETRIEAIEKRMPPPPLRRTAVGCVRRAGYWIGQRRADAG